MINIQGMMLFTGMALMICAFFLACGLIATATFGNIWWAVPVMGVTGAALSGAGMDNV